MLKKAIFVDRTDASDNPVHGKLVKFLNFGSTAYNTGNKDQDSGVTSKILEKESDDSETTEIAETSRSHLVFQDFAAYGTNKYSNSRDLSDIPEMFPTLIPYGRGGPDEERPVPMSHEYWAKRCFRVSGNRFQTHWGFLAIVYDYINMVKCFGAHYRSISTHKATLNGGWTAKKLDACIEYYKKTEEQLRKGEIVRMLKK